MITKKALSFLNCLVPPELADKNPFVSENSLHYLKYDSIKIENAVDAFSGLNVSFLWRGETVLIKRIGDLSIGCGSSLTLCDVEGRLRVDIEL